MGLYLVVVEYLGILSQLRLINKKYTSFIISHISVVETEQHVVDNTTLHFLYFLSIPAAHKANVSIKFAMISQYSRRVDPSALMNVIFPVAPPSSQDANMQNSV